jgi:hypothetical protein
MFERLIDAVSKVMTVNWQSLQIKACIAGLRLSHVVCCLCLVLCATYVLMSVLNKSATQFSTVQGAHVKFLCFF